MMETVEFKNKEKWNEFLVENQPVQFCQSFEWGEFQQHFGRKIFRLAILENNKILAVCLLIKMKLPLNKAYFYSPRGPVVQIGNGEFEKIFNLIIEKIKELAKQEKVFFWRFEPPVLVDNWRLKIKNCQKVADVQPSKTLILDLEKSEERLLAEMYPKTRYNIKLAERVGVKISYTSAAEDINVLLSLLHQTALRNNFKPHPDFYYRKMIKILKLEKKENEIRGVRYLSSEIFGKCFLKLIKAEYQNRILAANILFFFGDTATYLHGASADDRRNLMAPTLLQWQAILDAKEAGYQYYDFWGIDEKRWPGVTRFKNGFGGRKIQYSGTFDLIFDKFWYLLYSLSKKFISLW